MMTIEEMKAKLEKINEELEELQLLGAKFEIEMTSKGTYEDAVAGRLRNVQVIKGRLEL